MARADNHELSDIDLVIEFEPETLDLYSLKLKLKQEIQSKFEMPVDICRLKYIKPIFRNQIQRDIKYV
jgi:predicted nucleotidyltransferase